MLVRHPRRDLSPVLSTARDPGSRYREIIPLVLIGEDAAEITRRAKLLKLLDQVASHEEEQFHTGE
jgi:hypothetical protein